MLVKLPPAYTIPLDTAKALTVLLAFGFHSVGRPVEASNAATRFLGIVTFALKLPPAYTVNPLIASAKNGSIRSCRGVGSNIQVRIPRQRGTLICIYRSYSKSVFGTDIRKSAAGVNCTSVYGQSVNWAVRIGIPRRADAVGVYSGNVSSRSRADGGEVAANVYRVVSHDHGSH
jgi:hypothetical protein